MLWLGFNSRRFRTCVGIKLEKQAVVRPEACIDHGIATDILASNGRNISVKSVIKSGSPKTADGDSDRLLRGASIVGRLLTLRDEEPLRVAVLADLMNEIFGEIAV